ncbi:MAG: ABC transporter substrate-binding protein [Bacteroidia bacterium]|nr:ABC transporter substrate-binding protein [Bacteroidia bacterium]
MKFTTMTFIKTTLLFCTIAILFGCTTSTKQAETRTVFKYNESSGINSLDPAFAKDQSTTWATNQLYNGLVQMNNKLEVKPCIAKRWTVSADGLKYTFTLRNDVYFHNHELFPNSKGRKVIASDFVNSFFRIIDEMVASPGAWIFNNIDRSEKSGYLGFEAENDTTLNIYLNKPFPPFLGLLTMQYCSVVPHEIVEHYGKDFRNHPVGTGPFQFKLWKEGVKLVLLKNENYFERDNIGKPLPYLDAVAITFVSDKQTEFLDFVKGNIDFISGMDGRGSYKDEILTPDGKLNPKYASTMLLQSQPYLNTEYIGIYVDENQVGKATNPLHNKLVRQAISHGIDKQKLISYMRNNIGTAAINGIVPKGLPSFSNNVKGYEYNPAKAKKLLAEAGYDGTKKMPIIKISTTEKRLDIFEFIQNQLSEIGVNVNLEVNPSAVHRQMIAKSALNSFWASWIADYPDAENYFTLFYSKNFSPAGPNTTHFKNAEFDKLYEQSQNETADSLRYKTYQRMDQLLMNEAPIIPLYYDQVIRLYRNNIDGLESNALNLLILKNVKKNN